MTDLVETPPATVVQRFETAPKVFYGGTHRLVAPEQTLARVGPLMPAMGITRIANVTGLDSIGIPVVMVCRPNSLSLSVTQGKGLTLAAAKASGLMEAVEICHAERPLLPMMLDSYNGLRSTLRLTEPEALPLCAGSLYRPDFRLLWCLGEDLFDGEPLWAPHEMIHTDYTLPLPAGSGCFVKSSNGLASGNHLLEAISHGLCEVVERDALALWRASEEEARNATRLDLATVDHAPCREVLDKYEAAHVAAAVWDMTSDIGIPAYFCAIKDQSDDPLRLLYSTAGSGCHPDRGIALLRALTEAAQSRLTFISGARDDKPRQNYEQGRDPDILRHEQLEMDWPGPRRSFRQAPTYQAATFNEDVSWILERLRAIGIERAAFFDFTRPEFGIPVARVVVPGLEGADHSPQYAPGARAKAQRAREYSA
jgi:ribosomal protein S12 methylthiotransferase accessory factor